MWLTLLGEIMRNDVDLISVVFDVVICAGWGCLAFFTLVGKRTRARWASSILVGGGMGGAFVHIVMLLLRFHVFTLGDRGDAAVEMVVSDIDNVLLGLLIALIMSGQLIGKKVSAIVGNEPAI